MPVLDVLRELKSLFGAGAVLPAQLLESVLHVDDEDRKGRLITQALDQIARISRLPIVNM